MGFSTCQGGKWISTPGGGGYPSLPTHKSTRTCDGCDKCPKCDNFRITHLYCWRCCGPVKACPDCKLKLSQHIVEAGPPQKGWEEYADVVRGYERAVKIVKAVKAA